MNTSAPICISNYVRNGQHPSGQGGGMANAGSSPAVTSAENGVQRPIQSRGGTRRQAQSNIQGNIMRRTGGIGGGNNNVGLPYHQTHTTAFHQGGNAPNSTAVPNSSSNNGELGIISGNALNLNRA